MDDARLMRLSWLRVMIEEEGLCNVIGEVANALELIEEESMESADFEFSSKAKIIEYQKTILDMAMVASDINGVSFIREQIKIKLSDLSKSSWDELKKYGG